jgi:hypothetical protein
LDNECLWQAGDHKILKKQSNEKLFVLAETMPVSGYSILVWSGGNTILELTLCRELQNKNKQSFGTTSLINGMPKVKVGYIHEWQ